MYIAQQNEQQSHNAGAQGQKDAGNLGLALKSGRDIAFDNQPIGVFSFIANIVKRYAVDVKFKFGNELHGGHIQTALLINDPIGFLVVEKWFYRFIEIQFIAFEIFDSHKLVRFGIEKPHVGGDGKFHCFHNACDRASQQNK